MDTMDINLIIRQYDLRDRIKRLRADACILEQDARYVDIDVPRWPGDYLIGSFVKIDGKWYRSATKYSYSDDNFYGVPVGEYLSEVHLLRQEDIELLDRRLQEQIEAAAPKIAALRAEADELERELRSIWPDMHEWFLM